MTQNEIRFLLDQIEYKDWHFRLGVKGPVLYLQVVFQAPDNDDPGRLEQQKGRKWMLSEHMTRSEIVLTALKAVLTAEEHEAREKFLYKGKAVFNPHFDIEKYVALAGEQALDVRADPASSRVKASELLCDDAVDLNSTTARRLRLNKPRISDNRNQTE